MKHSQFLGTAQRLRIEPTTRTSAPPGLTQVRQRLLPTNATNSFTLLTKNERQILETQLKKCLAQERRRCNARAGSYDVNRHIQLYLMVKAVSAAPHQV